MTPLFPVLCQLIKQTLLRGAGKDRRCNHGPGQRCHRKSARSIRKSYRPHSFATDRRVFPSSLHSRFTFSRHILSLPIDRWIVLTQLLLQAFTDHYYNLFDTNRSALAGLYQDQSLLTFEGERFQGPQVGD
jgi:hypothetical protein